MKYSMGKIIMKNTYYSILFLAALMGCFSTSAQAVKVKVILLGGQSNMDGRAPGSGLPTTPFNLQQAQTDVLFYHGNASGQAYLPGNVLTKLAPGSGSKSPSSPTFGPEVTFGRSIADAYPGETFALIKYALGGSKLATDWNPSTGATYTAFRNTVTNGLAVLTNAGYTYEIAGMLWMQGESDSSSAYANAYQANLTAFIADIRSRYGIIPFVICETWRNEGDSTHPGTLGNIVSAAQQNIANTISSVGFVSTRSFTFQDDYHLNAQGQINLGYGCANYLISNNLISTLSVSSNSQADIAGHWSFDSNYNDVSGNGWNGTLVDTGTLGNSGITTTPGQYKWGDGALNLSSEQDYISLASKILSPGTAGYSISFWGHDRNAVKNQDGMVIGDNTGTSNFIWVDHNFGGIRYRATSSTYTADFMTTTAEDKDWHHYVIVVRDADNDAQVNDATLYVDGVSKGNVIGKAAAMTIKAIGHAYSGTQNYDYDGQIDELWIFNNAIDPAVVASLYHLNSPYPGAGNPNPANGQGLATDPAVPLYSGVNASQILSWSAPADPNLNPAYTITYSVYGDPNEAKVRAGDPTSTYYRRFTDTNALTQSFDPTPDLTYDTTWYWRVDSKVKKIGQADPNIIIGTIWRFRTANLLPTILTDPVNTKVKTGQTAQFTATYQSAGVITGVTWYKNNETLPADPHYTVTADQTTSTLTIANMDSSDAGSYYCVVATSSGTDTSAAATLAEKKLLAWYEFEQNAHDSAGTNHGTIVGPAMQYTAGKVTSDSQAYAADPDGTNYIALSTAAYPRAGFGNGLEEGTISYWAKIAPDAVGNVIGTYNGTASPMQYVTGMRIRVDSNGKIHFHVRDEDGNQAEPVSVKTVDDNEWHYVTAVVTKFGVTLYVDVTNQVTATSSTAIDNFASWQNPIVLLANNNRGTVEDYFPGAVDDLKIFNYAWTQEDAAQEYYNVTGKTSCIYPDQPELLCDYNHDCKVDMADFAMLAAMWFESGLYPL